jgi:2,3-bisphosphoglycerate-dependent phosphoglycerate mutase
MYKIVLLRHGESIWNKKGLFTGWTDVGLSSKGRQEAKTAGQELKEKGFVFDLAYTSCLKRASLTLKIALQELEQKKILTKIDWRLNERHYGNLQGLNKLDLVKKIGEKQVMIWRRSYGIRPPKISSKNIYNQKNDLKYKDIEVPEAESLKDVVARVVPFWKQEIVPKIKEGQHLIIVASGNSLRALVKNLDHISSRDIVNLNIPTGIPFVYEFDQNLKVRRHYYLTNPKKLKTSLDRVKNQTKA